MHNDQEKPLMEYEVERVTEYGSYTAVIQVTKHPRKTHIRLYSPKPIVTVFKFFPIELEPIREATYGSLVDVDKAIARMIVDWELVFYQRAKAEAADGHLDIDYAAEVKRRRARFEQPQEEEERQEQDFDVHDWQHGSYTVKRNQPEPEQKKKVHTNSLLNLKQYRHLKKSN